MLNTKGKTALIGSVGDDKWGKIYHNLLEKEGIVPIFDIIMNDNTGMCCVFCNKNDRAHITDLGASTKISIEFVESKIGYLKDIEFIYSNLFILKHRKDIVFMLADLAHKERKIFGFNLPSFYFLETYLEEINYLWEYSDVVFANEDEAKLFGILNNINVNIDNFRRIIFAFCAKN
jgi:sugar/nucleoside kinase (ribokinase family)